MKEILKQFKQFKQYNLKFRNLNIQSKTQKPTDEFIYLNIFKSGKKNTPTDGIRNWKLIKFSAYEYVTEIW